MATLEQIITARKVLESKWDAKGDCQSCGWHACLYEYDVSDEEIAYALDNDNGELELSCQNYEYGDPVGHRGVKIKIDA